MISSECVHIFIIHSNWLISIEGREIDKVKINVLLDGKMLWHNLDKNGDVFCVELMMLYFVWKKGEIFFVTFYRKCLIREQEKGFYFILFADPFPANNFVRNLCKHEKKEAK